MSCKKNSQEQSKISNNIFPTNNKNTNDRGDNASLEKNIESSDDVIKIKEKHNYMGNKERQNTRKFKGQQISQLETTDFASINHVLINMENGQITKKLELNNQIENNNYNDLFIKAINYSIDNICKFINKEAHSLCDLNFNYIYLKKIYEIDINNYEEFLESTIGDIYLGKFLKINHEERDKIKKWVLALLYEERKRQGEKFKLFNSLFSKKIEQIFLLYINDDPYIHENNTHYILKGFNTLIYDFPKERKQIKQFVYSLFYNNIVIEINNEEFNEQISTNFNS